jgi:hypothetical protein
MDESFLVQLPVSVATRDCHQTEKKRRNRASGNGGNMPFRTINPQASGENNAKKNICGPDLRAMRFYTHQTARALKSVIHHSCG